jgi:hypothetical protein
MKSSRPGRCVPRLASALAALAATGAAGAHAWAANCADLNLPSPIYGDGGTAAKPYLGKLATVLANLPEPVTVFFKGTGGCTAIFGLLKPTPLSGTVSYWDKTGKEQTCDLPAVGGPNQDWGNMVNSTKLCGPEAAVIPATIGDFEGPVTAVNFIAAKGSAETAISSEAAYLAYGFGPGGEATPWIDEPLLFKRNQSSAVGLYVGLSIGVPPNKQKGTLIANQTEGINKVSTAPNAQAALAYVSSDAADAARDKVKTLAYQHKGQACGFLPDSSDSSYDKKNVRDGHYWIWGAQHFFGTVDASKKLVNPGVAKLIGLVNGEFPAPAGVDVEKLAVDTGNVPRCAMQVWRDGDLGEFYSFAPPAPCGCWFEKNVPGGSTSCKACTADGDCASVGAGAKCRKNYCETY